MLPIISLQNVLVRYNLLHNYDGFKEYVIDLLKGGGKLREFSALSDINLSLEKGSSLGVVGFNGAGKSTLLKVMAGILKPMEGTAEINGSVAPLIELGAGFDNNLTAIENIYFNAGLRGIPPKTVKYKIDDIIEFAELEQFIDVPIKNYSSGMRARLGFASAVLFDADILIADEALSTGDYKFRKKCEDKIGEIIKKGATLIFVSHSVSQIETLCSECIWLDKGKIVMHGKSSAVCRAYEKNIVKSENIKRKR